mgnify:CR=1 FL=1
MSRSNPRVQCSSDVVKPGVDTIEAVDDQKTGKGFVDLFQQACIHDEEDGAAKEHDEHEDVGSQLLVLVELVIRGGKARNGLPTIPGAQGEEREEHDSP